MWGHNQKMIFAQSAEAIEYTDQTSVVGGG